jgi:hypothetical protein
MGSRAAILYEYGRPWSVEEFELDPPRAGEVLIQLRPLSIIEKKSVRRLRAVTGNRSQEDTIDAAIGFSDPNARVLRR